jgi:RNA polymerase sigma factor (TIGR02999 family)
MAVPPPEPITALIHAAARGDAASRERLLQAVYADLTRLARSHLARERTYTDLNAPALVHEAYLRFAAHLPADAASRRVFFQYASRAMQSVVIDHVRQRSAQKRGQGQAEVTLATGVEGAEERCSDERVQQVQQAMERLERVDAGLHEIVRLRCYAGLTVEQVAELLGSSPATVKRRWKQATAILRDALEG